MESGYEILSSFSSPGDFHSWLKIAFTFLKPTVHVTWKVTFSICMSIIIICRHKIYQHLLSVNRVCNFSVIVLLVVPHTDDDSARDATPGFKLEELISQLGKLTVPFYIVCL